MCIISEEVTKVAKTRIFAIPSKNGKRQLVVYSNTVVSPNDNLMLLPVPTPDSVVLETVSKTLFEDCRKSFKLNYETRSGRLMREFNAESHELAIIDHGSYSVVIVPSMNDLDKIPSSFATVSSDVDKFMKKTYPVSYGIVACKLKQGCVDYEPFAYSYNIEQDSLFIPTMHFHKHPELTSSLPPVIKSASAGAGAGSYNAYYEQYYTSMKNAFANFSADWDHDIYTFDRFMHNATFFKPDSHNCINWSEMPTDYQYDSSIILSWHQRESKFKDWPNEDIRVAV